LTLASRFSRSLDVIGTNTDRSATYDFLLTFHSNRFWDKMVISVESHNFYPPPVFFVAAERVPLGIGFRRWGSKTTTMDLLGREKVWQYLQPCGYSTATWQTDRQTDTGRQQRPRLRTASCGKNKTDYRQGMKDATSLNLSKVSWVTSVNDEIWLTPALFTSRSMSPRDLTAACVFCQSDRSTHTVWTSAHYIVIIIIIITIIIIIIIITHCTDVCTLHIYTPVM